MNREGQRRWHAFPDDPAMYAAALDIVATAAAEAILERGQFHLVLSGGNTPRALYVSLRAIQTDWSAWHIYFGDERCLPVMNSERNSYMAAEVWLNHVPILSKQFHPIAAEMGPTEAARLYTATLQQIDEFDLVLLGLGEDGHTASLFPGHYLGAIPGSPDVLTVFDAPKPPSQRVSLSANRLCRSRQVMFIVNGEAKRQAVADWWAGGDIPAQSILPASGIDVLLPSDLLAGAARSGNLAKVSTDMATAHSTAHSSANPNGDRTATPADIGKRPGSEEQPEESAPVKMRHGRRSTDPVFRMNAASYSSSTKRDTERQPASDDKNGQTNDEKSAKPDKEQSDDESEDDDGKAGKKDGEKDGEKDKPRSKLPLIILALVILLAAIIGFIWWFATRNQVSTDDAFTDGNAVVMSPNVSGYVAALLVNDNAYVHKGDLLVQIDASQYEATRDDAAAQVGLAQAQLDSSKIALSLAGVQYPAQLAQARSQEKSTQAALVQAQATYDRQHAVDPRATTQENIDAATSQERVAQANVESARAQAQIAAQVGDQLRQARNKVAQAESQLQQAQAKLAAAQLNVAYCRLTAPSDGWITKRNVQQGSYLAAGTPMFVLVTPDIWVTANFKESQLERMKPGDTVALTVDAYPSLELSGHIDSIQLGSGSHFSAFPTENATGNFVKIVQRVPVKIVIDKGLDPAHPLPLGLSVSPVVKLR